MLTWEELGAFYRTGLGFKMLTKWRYHLEKIRGDSEKDEHKVVNLGENKGLPRYRIGRWLSSNPAERGWSWWRIPRWPWVNRLVHSWKRQARRWTNLLLNWAQWGLSLSLEPIFCSQPSKIAMQLKSGPKKKKSRGKQHECMARQTWPLRRKGRYWGCSVLGRKKWGDGWAW